MSTPGGDGSRLRALLLNGDLAALRADVLRWRLQDGACASGACSPSR